MMELLISWCVTSSILLAVFLLLRGTVFRKLSPRVRYALWGVVLLRLLVPFQIPSLSLPASAADLAPELPVLSNRPLSPDTAMGHAVIPSDLLEENGLTIADDGTVQASPSGHGRGELVHHRYSRPPGGCGAGDLPGSSSGHCRRCRLIL